MRKLFAILLLLTVNLMATEYPLPLIYNRFDTGFDASPVNGDTLTNIPLSGIVGLSAFQSTNANLTSWQAHQTNDYYGTNANLQAGTANGTNWSLHVTNDYVATVGYVAFTNTLGTAAFSGTTSFQPTSQNLTNWALHRTNDYYGTNVNLQAGSTVLTNFALLGTNAFVPYGNSLTKGEFPVYNGTNYTTQDPPAGTSVLTYNIAAPTGLSWVNQVDPALLGTGSSLSTATLFRDGVWRVTTVSTDGTNIVVFLPSQFATNVNGQVYIKDGASVTNLQANGTTAANIINAATIGVGELTTSVATVVSNLSVGDGLLFIGNGSADLAGTLNAAVVYTGDFSASGSLLTNLNGGGQNITNLDSVQANAGEFGDVTINSIFQLSPGAVAGYVLTSDASGNGTWQAPSGGGGSGSQTPLTNTVDAAQLPITNLSDIGFTPQDANFSSLIHVGATNGLGFRHSDEGNNIGNWYAGDATVVSAFSTQVMADDGAHDPRITFVSGSDNANTMRWRPGVLGAGGGRFSDGSDNYFLTYDGAGHVSLPSLTTLPQCFSITGSVDADLNVTASSMRSVKLQGGDSEDPDDAGGVIIKGGAATGAGTGGNITIQGGASSGGTQGTVNVLSVTHVLDAVDTNSPVTLFQLTNSVHNTLVQTNFVAGQLYTNEYGSLIHVTASAALTEAAVVGMSQLSLQVPTQVTNRASALTVIGGLTGTLTNAISTAYVPAGATYRFVDTSAGAGNSASPVGGQIWIP